MMAATFPPRLRLVPGGWRLEEARVEVLAFIGEVTDAMRAIENAELSRDVPSSTVIHHARRIAFKAGAAREQYLSLTDPSPAA